MKTFTINRHITIEAEYYETRYSWGHKAYMYIDGRQVEDYKITYYNRTWEAYQFQSILESIVDRAAKNKTITGRQAAIASKLIKNGFVKEAHKETKQQFQTVTNIALMGEVFGTNQKEKNDWKARMLKAGLQGLSMPEDWETLSEDEKTVRLDKVIKELKK